MTLGLVSRGVSKQFPVCTSITVQTSNNLKEKSSKQSHPGWKGWLLQAGAGNLSYKEMNDVPSCKATKNKSLKMLKYNKIRSRFFFDINLKSILKSILNTQ